MTAINKFISLKKPTVVDAEDMVIRINECTKDMDDTHSFLMKVSDTRLYGQALKKLPEVYKDRFFSGFTNENSKNLMMHPATIVELHDVYDVDWIVKAVYSCETMPPRYKKMYDSIYRNTLIDSLTHQYRTRLRNYTIGELESLTSK